MSGRRAEDVQEINTTDVCKDPCNTSRPQLKGNTEGGGLGTNGSPTNEILPQTTAKIFLQQSEPRLSARRF